ncbi:MAG: hypothetical protein CMB75_04320 [Euryarchaeota archaeon]|nr:hypothetical protein [Euryarchaeota archaeon]
MPGTSHILTPQQIYTCEWEKIHITYIFTIRKKEVVNHQNYIINFLNLNKIISLISMTKSRGKRDE